MKLQATSRRIMKGIKYMQIRSVFLLCVIFLFPAPFLNVKHALGESDVPPPCNPIFKIGELNRSPAEFYSSDFVDIQEVEIDADGVVELAKIPRRLIHPDGLYSPNRHDAVKELRINFTLMHEDSGLILRLARSGDSDTLVKIDNAKEYRVSAEMLGSGEGGKFGVYDLHLSLLNKGNHKISLTIPDDGLGYNGSYSWDAIILFSESPTDKICREQGLVYGRGDDVDLKLNLARPINGNGPFPALIFLFGGSYRTGMKELWNDEIQEAAKRGYVAVTIDYRLTKLEDDKGITKYTFPAQLYDGKCAIRWLRANAEKYKIDSNRIGVVGFSSGGNLALMMGLTNSSHGLEGDCGDDKISSRVQAVVNLAGFTDSLTHSQTKSPSRLRSIEAWLGGSPDQLPERYKKSSPLNFVSSDDPPVLSICGTLDFAFPQVKLLDERMNAAGVYHILISKEEIAHAKEHLVNFHEDNPAWDFLDRYLKTE